MRFRFPKQFAFFAWKMFVLTCRKGILVLFLPVFLLWLLPFDWHWRQFNILEIKKDLVCQHIRRQLTLISAIIQKAQAGFGWSIYCLNKSSAFHIIFFLEKRRQKIIIEKRKKNKTKTANKAPNRREFPCCILATAISQSFGKLQWTFLLS